MPTRFEVYRRLEPIHPHEDLDRGFRAEVHDPAWFLGRQWQLGEFHGEDASTPVRASYRASHDAIDPYGGDARWDPAEVPPETVIESEPGDWWTIGRRIRIGLEAGSGLKAPSSLDPNDPADADLIALLLPQLPPPYGALFETAYDGRALHERRAALGLAEALFAEVPISEPDDLWDPAELVYMAEFRSGGTTLSVVRHDGGHLDWYSTDADRPLQVPSPLPDAKEVYPTQLEYPGAPHPRWWQIENARVDIGGFPPDRSHFPTMLLVDLIVSHADDWFTFPVDTRAGRVVTIHELEVKDSFDEAYVVSPATDWSLFRVTGLNPTSLVVWPSVPLSLSGTALEEVVVGIDEDANLLWAVEKRLAGRDVDPARPPVQAAAAQSGLVDASRKSYDYRASTPIPHHWHPYEIRTVTGRRRFVQARLANLNATPPELMPEPRAALISRPAPEIHQIEPATIPVTGLRLQRRWMLARRTDGSPLLWMQRRRFPLLAPPVSGLRFDILEDSAPQAT